MNFYNDTESYVCEWSKNLIAANLVPNGVVCSRSICDIEGWEIVGYNQCHFFSGILGWPLALQMAGWPADLPVWTGSCPCQPFSVAGKQKGINDERHVWPAWFNLIRQCRPPIIFGEQVEGAIRHGWLDGIFRDLEGEGYSCGAAVLGAHSIGAPHIRQRLYWVAYSQHTRLEKRWRTSNLISQDRQPIGLPSVGVCSLPVKVDPLVGLDMGSEHTGWANEPEAIRVDYGVSSNVGQIRAYGNAIVPQVAAEFIRGTMDVLGVH